MTNMKSTIAEPPSSGPGEPRTPPDPIEPEQPPPPDPRDPDPYPRYEDVPPAQPIDGRCIDR